ncbi:MAG: PEP-CTERM sorting domain-containing protein [Acidobacteria bacterium]|nr:PEP-CTERM sorting domain-containing protein [Acidobacteriota bacterium]
MTKLPMLGALATALFTLPVPGAIIYDNTATDTFNSVLYSAAGLSAIGDQISLGGTERNATQAMAQFYNFGAIGTFDAVLQFYAVGAPLSQIGGPYTVTGIAAAANAVIDVTFTGLGLTLPDEVIFQLSVLNSSSGVDVGPNLFDPPIFGSSSNSFFIGDTVNQTTGLNVDNIYFRLEADGAIPEPSTIVLSALCLAGIAALRRHR